jgi:hypothetical protein
MDKFLELEKLSETTYRIAMYLVFFVLGIQLACYVIEKHSHDMPEVVFVPSPCEECEEKRREREKQEHGRSKQDS